MGLSWQQGPLGRHPSGTFLTATPMPDRVLYMERLPWRMSVKLGGTIILRSEDAVILFESARYPVAYFRSATSSAVYCSPLTTRAPTPIWARRHGSTSSAATAGSRNAAPGSTSIRRRRQLHCTTPSRSRGARWTPSTKRTSASSAMLPTPTTASTSAAALGISSFETATSWSRTRTLHSCSTSPASHRAGTSLEPTSSLTPSSWSKGRPSVPTRGPRP
jgi:hypothetical protein